ncbi:glycerate kinase [Micrococcales bacterium KH10]|nr:glycerate kinase [Micrococcales bacterium KH10]
MAARRVLIAPDSFKGSIRSVDAAQAIARGWHDAHPDDQIELYPMADGGEGTTEVLAYAIPQAHWRGLKQPRTTKDGPGPSRWLQLPDGTAVIELAASCGLELYDKPQPMTASTYALGQTIAAALDAGATSLVIALGGSASTDGGTGALRALGARFLDKHSRDLPLGGGALQQLATIDVSNLRQPPPGGVEVLTDVATTLLDPHGAAHTFAPQKGATPEQVEELATGLRRLDDLVHRLTRQAANRADTRHADEPGSGAAGGTGYGLMALWQTQLVPGAKRIADLVGMPDSLETYDVVISGEGQLDDTTAQGKVVHEVLSRAENAQKRIVICGTDARTMPDTTSLRIVELSTLARSARAAMNEPARWLTAAGKLINLD